MPRYDEPEEVYSNTDDRVLRILDMVGDSLGIDMSGVPDCIGTPDEGLTLDDLLGALIDDLTQERKALQEGPCST